MMNKTMIKIFGYLIAGVVLSCTLMVTVSLAQERSNDEIRPSPNATVGQTIGTTDVHITYGRPSVNNREVFGGLDPYDEVWRAGANEATTISFSKDVLIEGEPLEAGIYSFYTIPRANDNWTIIFNGVPNQWGLTYNQSEDVLRVDVTAESEAPHMEQLIYYFEDIEGSEGTAVLHWSDVRVPFTIEEAGE